MNTQIRKPVRQTTQPTSILFNSNLGSPKLEIPSIPIEYLSRGF